MMMKLTQRLALCWRILREKPGNTLAHTERELLPPNGDEMQALMNQNLRELVLVFSTQGHSGFSASYATAALAKLLAFEPLRPLTGEPDEWCEVGPGVFQNRRCGRVFKDATVFGGQAYDIEGKVFRDHVGAYTSINSRVPVVFPYTPRTEYVDVPAEA
jgi:hypothetical protein